MSSKLNIGSVIWNATTGVEVGTIVNSTQLDLKANKAQEAWIAPTLLNGWVNAGGFGTAYFKDEFGFVHLKGLVSSGSLGVTVFTLPEGYRPAISTPISSVYRSGGTYGSYSVNINTDGTIFLFGTAGTTWNALNNISFKVGN